MNSSNEYEMVKVEPIFIEKNWAIQLLMQILI